MKSDDMSEEKIDALLKEVAPHLSTTKAMSVQPPPYVVDKLNKALATAFPKTQLLSVRDMRLVILKLLTQQQQMDGVQITAALRKTRLVLKDAGEGAVYGLLHELTNAGFLESKLDPTEARVKVYRITKDGRTMLDSPVAKSPQLFAYFERIVEPSI